MVRLDAIGFMWKAIGTRCLHLPQAHALIQLMRLVFDETAPHVALVTETNVPHLENISYFGDGRNEAQMVYNFSLPPLTLHAFHTGDATVLSQWAATLTLPSDQVTFFNFLASHDGIGVTPARALLSDAEIDAMVARVQALGGLVSYKTNSDGSQSAYELNINYLDALGEPGVADSAETQAQRFLCAQAIMLALRGVPGIYFHSLFGSQNWLDGVAQTGRNRTINREKLPVGRLERELEREGGLRHLVFDGYRRLLALRSAEIAFYPYGEQRILDLHPAVFAVERSHNGETILCLHNVSREPVTVTLPYGGEELIGNGERLMGNCELGPYSARWLRREG
jgi:sucrose phosphorylase